MFFSSQSADEQNKYELLLRIIGSLSKLSSDNDSIPYLYYRMAENIFCRAFIAKNLSRSDISIDASKDSCGIGLKTFLHKRGHCLEKIAEFNRERTLYLEFINNPEQLILNIAKLRNKRILSTCGICSLPSNELIYHCVTRKDSIFYIHEEPMNLINIDNLSINPIKNNTISFTDEVEEYSFNISKSTLSKKFHVNPLHQIDVKIFEDPFELLEKYLSSEFEEDKGNKIIGSLYLPLYSYDKSLKTPLVPLKSGLNLWNAEGRARNVNEVYIRVPTEIKKFKPDFFPTPGTSFTLSLPNGKFLIAKICQEKGKALMSNPNRDLGKWVLRDVLNVQEHEIVTYQKLEEIGIDTVQINKFEDGTYEINFKKTGTFEKFKIEESIG